MNAATTVGRHPLSTRFTANVRIATVDYPDPGELTVVYDTLLEAAFNGRQGMDSRCFKLYLFKLLDIYLKLVDSTLSSFCVWRCSVCLDTAVTRNTAGAVQHVVLPCSR